MEENQKDKEIDETTIDECEETIEKIDDEVIEEISEEEKKLKEATEKAEEYLDK